MKAIRKERDAALDEMIELQIRALVLARAWSVWNDDVRETYRFVSAWTAPDDVRDEPIPAMRKLGLDKATFRVLPGRYVPSVLR